MTDPDGEFWNELEAALPTCPKCIHRLEVAGTEERPYWECPACGYVAVAV